MPLNLAGVSPATVGWRAHAEPFAQLSQRRARHPKNLGGLVDAVVIGDDALDEFGHRPAQIQAVKFDQHIHHTMPRSST